MSKRWLSAMALILIGCSVSSEITDYCMYSVNALKSCVVENAPTECSDAWQPQIDRFCERE